MKFDDSLIDQVRNSINIVDLVGRYVHLKKKGKDFGALCPFHPEKTPSFQVSESKQIFKCFGCGEGGDVFKFVMLIEALSFPEAIRHLAESCGIPLPQMTGPARERIEDREELFEILARAASFFSLCLQENAAAGTYLSERGIESATAEKFAIGYAPPGQQLLDELRKQGFPVARIVECGLAKESDRGEFYDKFRNRIMFPIKNLSGKTIAFGGRILGDGQPKYLNSPDTPLYSKSHHLYPLEVTRDEIRRRDFAVLVEGYFDCVVPFQFGVRNIVASLGTSLTEDQVKLLKRHTQNVVTNYDPDTAGVTATIRSIDLFLEHGFHVNVLKLPDGQDPDTYIRREGAEKYLEILKSSQPYLDFLLGHFMSLQKDPYSPKGKQEVISAILPTLAKIPNRIERAEYSSRIAARLRIDEMLLLQELGKIPLESAGPARASVGQPGLRVEPATLAEETLLSAFLDREWSEFVSRELEVDLLEGLRTKEVFLRGFELKKDGRELTPANLIHALTDQTERHLLERATLRSGGHPISRDLILESIQALRKKQLDRMSRRLQEEIASAERAGSSQGAEFERLLAEKERLRRVLSREEGRLLSPEDARE